MSVLTIPLCLSGVVLALAVRTVTRIPTYRSYPQWWGEVVIVALTAIVALLVIWMAFFFVMWMRTAKGIV